MANVLSLTCELNKECFAATDQQQKAYLLVEAKPLMSGINEKTKVNFCLVMDRSASMKGQKIENVKTAIKNIIDRLDNSNTISLVTFNEQAEVILPAQLVSNKEQLKNMVDQLKPKGGTAISTGIQAGLKELAKYFSKDKVNRMLMLTDGQTYGDEDQCYDLAAEAAIKGVSITALGVGDEWREELLDSIAEKNKGRSDYIATPAEILPIFDGELTTLENIITKNNTLTIRFSEGIHPRKICRVLPFIEELEHASFTDNEISVTISELDKENGQSFLVELMLSPKQPGSYRIAQAELSYDIPGKNLARQKIRTDVVLKFASENEQYQMINHKVMNPKVMNIIERVSAYDLQTRVITQVNEGDVHGATLRLRAAATRLLNLGETDLAEAALVEADNLAKKGAMSSAGTKKLRYETRKLTQRLF